MSAGLLDSIVEVSRLITSSVEVGLAPRLTRTLADEEARHVLLDALPVRARLDSAIAARWSAAVYTERCVYTLRV